MKGKEEEEEQVGEPSACCAVLIPEKGEGRQAEGVGGGLLRSSEKSQPR